MCTDCACGQPARAEPTTAVAEPAAGARRTLHLQRGLLAKNDLQARRNRALFAAHGLAAINLLSAPGSGKTALLERIARQWPHGPVGVIVGDLATDNDARRLRAAGARAVQISTGQACHLEADWVARAFGELDHHGLALLVIENIGNLVCPSAYDLGESLRLAVLSVTEGEDKPLKYPALFQSADAILLNKIDLAAAVGFDRPLALDNLQRVAPQAVVFEVSARSGEGLEALMAWLARSLSAAAQPAPA